VGVTWLIAGIIDAAGLSDPVQRGGAGGLGNKPSPGAPCNVDEGTRHFCPGQFCSPGFNLPVGCFMRIPHGQFPEYHTSADDLDFVKPASLADSFSKCLSVFRILDSNLTYLNKKPKCEPQLGRRGLYQMIGGSSNAKSMECAMLWALNLSDGNHSLLQIAEQSGIPFQAINDAATALLSRGLLMEIAVS
jgi:aminopeptidase-like protein